MIMIATNHVKIVMEVEMNLIRNALFATIQKDIISKKVIIVKIVSLYIILMMDIILIPIIICSKNAIIDVFHVIP